MAYTTDDLVTSVQRDSFLPASQGQWTAAKILALGDKMIHRRIAPALLEVKDGYYRETTDITLVAAQASYDIPRYAMFNKIHQAMLVATDGVTLGSLLRKDPPDLKYWNSTTAGTPNFIRFDGDQLTVNPTPNAGSLLQWPTLRVWIYRRPGRMVSTSAAAVVSSVGVAGVVTYTGAPPATHTSSSIHDFYSNVSPFRRVGSAATASAQSGSTQTFSVANAALLSAGFYVCLRDETVYPPCSIEVQPFLEELIIQSMSNTQGDKSASDASMKSIVDDMMLLIGASSNRADAMPQVASLMHSPFVRGLSRRGLRSTRS